MSLSLSANRLWRRSLVAMVMMIFSSANASVFRHQPDHAKTRISMLQSHETVQRTGKVQKIVADLQKALKSTLNGNGVADADGDQNLDDDSDEDDDDVEKKAEEVDEEEKEDEAAAKALKSAEQMSLKVARHKHENAKADLKAYQDDSAFDRKIAAEVKLITNETQAPALASFLGTLRSEMREYSRPTYPQFLEAKVTAAEKRVIELEAQLKGKQVQAAKVEKKAQAEEPKTVVKVASAKADEEEVETEVKAAPAKEADADEATTKEIARKAGEVWAISFFANIIMISIVFAWANTANAKMRTYTWFLIDQVIAVFLAVMYFQAFDSLIDFHELLPHQHVLSAVLHAVTILGIVLFVAYKFRSESVSLAIVCGAGAHLVSMSSIHAGATVQNKVWIAYSYTSLMAIFGICVLGLGIFVVGYLVWTAKKRADLLKDDEFMDRSDDLENDFGSMSFSVVFTMFIRFLLTGHHPDDDETEFDHTKSQRTRMFIYACFCLVVAAFATRYFAKKASEAASANNYPMKRIYNFLTTVTAMNVAWAFLYWGEWEFFEALYPGEAIKGRVMFAIVMTTCGGMALLGLSKTSKEAAQMSGGCKGAEQVLITAVSLLVAWSWELCFDAAVEDMTDGVSHPASWKVAATLSLMAVVIPVYAYYVKPAVQRNGADG